MFHHLIVYVFFSIKHNVTSMKYQSSIMPYGQVTELQYKLSSVFCDTKQSSLSCRTGSGTLNFDIETSFFFLPIFKVGKIYAILKRQTTRIKLPKHLYILFAGVSISSLWPATAIKAFVTDKLGTPPSVMRTPDVFADAVLGIAEEKSDKSVWKFGSLVFCGLKVVHI